ncbi:MAG: trypsin-like peptidase domain-containing protein [Pirellulales bacterium]
MQNRIAPLPRSLRSLLAIGLLLPAVVVVGPSSYAWAKPSALRRTAIVRAVERARPSVVNIQGQKTLNSGSSRSDGASHSRRVNGMGTGVVIDERGYIVTNHHVVDGVSRIQVTLSTGKTYIARLVERDPLTDLAVIKINVGSKLPVIHIGTSSDLMVGESVIAVGNAYGYENTVTRGVISALHRTVQISDAQTYEDLIQTDASINPGNSGGPLLNIEGEMIGINVAVRSGAQGIGFAIPVDMAMQVTAHLLDIRRLDRHWHGVIAREVSGGSPQLVVAATEKNSPAEKVGLQPGDRITEVGSRKVVRALDLERALLGRKEGEEIKLVVQRSKQPLTLNLVLAASPTSVLGSSGQLWNQLGLRLRGLDSKQLRPLHPRYRGGLTVADVRSGSPADEQGIQPGDVLVGMHIWETVSMENVQYILNRVDAEHLQPLKFYILRGNQPYFGYLSLVPVTRR